MKSLYESILDNDIEVTKNVSINSTFVSIKNVMTDMFEDDYEVCRVNDFINSSYKCEEVIFHENRGQFKSLSDTAKKLKDKLSKIKDVKVNYNLQKINKIFRKYSEFSPTEVAVFEIFLDNEKILEMYMGDMFVNYKSYNLGLSYTFDISEKYQKFIELFK